VHILDLLEGNTLPGTAQLLFTTQQDAELPVFGPVLALDVPQHIVGQDFLA
jgi:hypothetical protein